MRRKEVWERINSGTNCSDTRVSKRGRVGEGRPKQFASEVAEITGVSKVDINRKIARARLKPAAPKSDRPVRGGRDSVAVDGRRTRSAEVAACASCGLRSNHDSPMQRQPQKRPAGAKLDGGQGGAAKGNRAPMVEPLTRFERASSNYGSRGRSPAPVQGQFLLQDVCRPDVVGRLAARLAGGLLLGFGSGEGDHLVECAVVRFSQLFCLPIDAFDEVRC